MKIIVIKPEGPPKLCKTDEVGELCVASGTVGSAYFGLVGKTNHTFKVSMTCINMRCISVHLKTSIVMSVFNYTQTKWFIKGSQYIKPHNL